MNPLFYPAAALAALIVAKRRKGSKGLPVSCTKMTVDTNKKKLNRTLAALQQQSPRGVQVWSINYPGEESHYDYEGKKTLAPITWFKTDSEKVGVMRTQSFPNLTIPAMLLTGDMDHPEIMGFLADVMGKFNAEGRVSKDPLLIEFGWHNTDIWNRYLRSSYRDQVIQPEEQHLRQDIEYALRPKSRRVAVITFHSLTNFQVGVLHAFLQDVYLGGETKKKKDQKSMVWTPQAIQVFGAYGVLNMNVKIVDPNNLPREEQECIEPHLQEKIEPLWPSRWPSYPWNFPWKI